MPRLPIHSLAAENRRQPPFARVPLEWTEEAAPARGGILLAEAP